MSRRIPRPLNKASVQAADNKFYENHPELVQNGQRIPLDPGEPDQETLRQEWKALYLATEKTEEKRTASRPVQDPRQLCPLSNWVELQYCYVSGKGVPGAKFTLKTPGPRGVVLATGALDDKGFTHIAGLPNDLTQIIYSFANDPPLYKIFDSCKPKPNPHLQPDPEYLEKAGEAGTLRKVGKWVWGTLQGDFNEDPDLGQIALNTAITLIPFVDQAGDVRDIAASGKQLIWEERYDEFWVWFGLVITIVGCIPEVGSVLKGILKAIKLGGKSLDLAKLLRKLNSVGEGNAVRWLKELQTKLPDYGKQAAEHMKGILNDFASKLERVKRFVSREAAAQIDQVLNSVKEVLKRVDRMVDEVINDLKKRLDEILADGKHAETPGSTKTKDTRRQESEPLLDEAIEKAAKEEAEKAELLSELKQAGVKHTPEDVVRIAKTRDGKVTFLEKGRGKAQTPKPSGLAHITEEHGEDFARRGISEEQIPDVVMKAVTDGKVVGTAGRGRPVYEVEFNDKLHHIAVTTGNNGYIVGANPVSSSNIKP